ncbi:MULTISPECIES: phosphate ABC transporter permease PstA [Nocardiopsis]|uniref:Phosphate transport system permease protein PstA n=1 Tax=Nocardiopsis sinuspersici TaxID=501010 RepID=A0A1V3C5A1_9ACTN|nr:MULTISPECIES: phosphate ABC transporter permease PstA [Nocardiopsis]NYH52316.1 phosphate transport system permease protein [Nocardiopsis sinuspersici]OOC55812.1 phosphate ABC transporter, permease protein PstA [Nocardiopsis sinuspersici]
MSTTTTQPPAPGPGMGSPRINLRSGTLPRRFPAALLASCAAVVAGVLLAFSSFGFLLWGVLTAVAYVVIAVTASARVEGGRKAKDRLVTSIVYMCFLLAMLPLASVLWTVFTNGMNRLDIYFLSVSMNGVLPSMDAGGAYHAIVGTLAITGMATLISVPIGVMTAVYLVEYAQGRMKQLLMFFVDVMTGIPSIVAGLFVVALWMVLFGPGHTNGAAGAIALAVLMIPVVVRSSEEMLRLVPQDLREAAYALGVPRWRTITKVVLPTSAAGLTTGIMLAIARVIGETAPLILTAGTSAVSINWNLFDGQMMNLPVFIYSQVRMGGAINYERAWAAALTLILVVMLLFFLARMIGGLFAPKAR